MKTNNVMLDTLARAKTWYARKEAKAAIAKLERFKPPEVMPGTIPKDEKLAMDSIMLDNYAFANSSIYGHESFPGYPALSELTQQPEYRMITEKKAEAMVRKWIKFSSKGDGDKSEAIAAIEDAMLKFKIRELFHQCAVYDGWMGRAQLFIDVRTIPGDPDPQELEMPLLIDPAKIPPGSLVKFKMIEPIVTYPYKYNASNPLSDDYYNPTTWFVMGQQIHSTRLLMFLSKPVPDLLKPSYNFGGISMSQMARPYVENWKSARTHVGRLLRNFSTSGIKTNMQSTLAGIEGDDDSYDVVDRAELYTELRDNSGLMMLDKDSEEFFQINTPLTTVDKLQAQAQEQMSSVSSTPLSVLTGITPTGLNASSDGEIRIWYDYVLSQQMLLFNDPLKVVLDVIQLHLFGQIDPDITFEFVSLWQMDTKEMAAVRKSDAEAADLYFQMGAISNSEVRQKLASDPESGYSGLSLAPDIRAAAQPGAQA